MGHKSFDPRDPQQLEGDPETWKETDNPALVVASIPLLLCGHTMTEAERAKLIELADFCDEQVESDGH